MRILVAGGSGFLGGNLVVQALQAGHDVGFTYRQHGIHIPGATALQTDALDPISVQKNISRFRPDALVHCIGLANPDLCEEDPTLGWSINVDTARNVVRALRGSGTRLLYISTDCLFDGKKRMYTEADTPHPLNAYARTKLEAERVALDHPDSVVVRTNFYGFAIQNERHFAHWLHTRLKNREPVPAFSDYFFTPLLVNNLCDALLELAAVPPASGYRGILNLSSPDRCSRFDFAQQFARTLGLPSESIRSTPLAEGKLRAPRPLECTLSNEKARKLLKTPLLAISDGIARYKQLLDEGYPEKIRRYAPDARPAQV